MITEKTGHYLVSVGTEAEKTVYRTRAANSMAALCLTLAELRRQPSPPQIRSLVVRPKQ